MIPDINHLCTSMDQHTTAEISCHLRRNRLIWQLPWKYGQDTLELYRCLNKDNIRGFHERTKLAILALMPNLYSHIFAVFFFISTI